jgi:hypothetical protein
VLLYDPPNDYLLRTTYNTLVVCRKRDVALSVIDIRSILSVIAMAPFPFLIDSHGDQYFMIEKAGLDVIEADALEDDE